MLRALNIAASGMNSQETNVNTIANNIANVNTTGFKQGRTEFEDLLYETVQESGAKSGSDSEYNVGIQYGSGSKVSGIRKIHTQGNPMTTNNPFDLMINGEGFFGVIQNNGEVSYTRDGSFNIDKNGSLVTKNGDKVFPGITVPQGTTSVNISNNGTVEAYTKGEIEPQNLGTISVFTFINPSGLKSEGGNLLMNTNSSGEPIQNTPGTSDSGTVLQGMLESSNVNVMNEMTNLIRAQRAYEMNSKVLGVADQILQNTNNIR
jgi:flagellar basal-body rod protein FlgG